MAVEGAAPQADKDLASISEALALARVARQAQILLAELSQEQIDAIVTAMAGAVTPHAETLARLAVEETGYGGGAVPGPSEISLAHNGVLSLDEMSEFDRRVLEVLRQPLEDGRVTIARAARTAVFPVHFVLVAAMNPCPCGFLGDKQRMCRCTPIQIAKYRGRLSGPLRDRIDLIADVSAVPVHAITDTQPGESTAAVRGRVCAARSAQ